MGDKVSQQTPNQLILEEAHPDHAYALAPNLREADKREFSCCFSSQFPDTASMLVYAVEQAYESSDSKVYTISDEHGVIHGMWGFTPWEAPTFVAPVGAVWLCSDDTLFDVFPKTITRIAREEILPRLDKRWAAYGNLVHSKNYAHVRWLTHCGFRTYARTERAGEPFTFMMRANGARWHV